MNFTLDSINREREIDKENKKKIVKHQRDETFNVRYGFQWQVLLFSPLSE